MIHWIDSHVLKVILAEFHFVYNLSNLKSTFLIFSLQRRMPSQRLNSHKRHKRRRKVVVVAVKPKRRSGRKEKFVTSWTIKSSSIRLLMRNFTRKFQPTSSLHHLLCPKDWRCVDHLQERHSLNSVIKVKQSELFVDCKYH